MGEIDKHGTPRLIGFSVECLISSLIDGHLSDHGNSWERARLARILWPTHTVLPRMAGRSQGYSRHGEMSTN